MSQYAKRQIRTFGEARAIVVIKDEKEAARYEKYFRWGAREQEAIESASFGVPAGGAAPAREGYSRTPESPARHLKNLGILYGTVDAVGWQALQNAAPESKALRGAPQIRPIRPARPSAPAAPSKISWGIERLRIPELWKEGLSGQGVRVAHLDTGVNGDHPAFAGAVAEFAEFDFLGERIDHAKAFDSASHGTHTAGIIAGREVNQRRVGVAPGCSLVCGIVIEGGDLTGRVLAGVDWAIGKGARILNLSLGYPEYWEDYVPLLDVIRSKGILPVFAVGNEGPGTSRSPGNYARAISVGAFGEDGRILQESGSQRFNRPLDPIVPDLVMPGGNVISADAQGGFRAESGTSMAAPHLAGLAALLWEAKPAATVDEIESCVFASCDRPGELSEDRANRGIPDATVALRHLRQGTARPRVRRKRVP